MASRGAGGEGASAASGPGGSSTTSPTPASAAELPPSPGLVPTTPPAVIPPGSGTAGAADGTDAAEPVTAGVCSDLGADACGACVCEQCATELAACAGVEGCVEILACVRASGCSGRDCYCGSASLADCLAGDAQGPCRDVVLRAPGASAPTLQDPSAGPASDASLQVADCAQARGTCRDFCGAGD